MRPFTAARVRCFHFSHIQSKDAHPRISPSLRWSETKKVSYPISPTLMGVPIITSAHPVQTSGSGDPPLSIVRDLFCLRPFTKRLLNGTPLPLPLSPQISICDWHLYSSHLLWWFKRLMHERIANDEAQCQTEINKKFGKLVDFEVNFIVIFRPILSWPTSRLL